MRKWFQAVALAGAFMAGAAPSSADTTGQGSKQGDSLIIESETVEEDTDRGFEPVEASAAADTDDLPAVTPFLPCVVTSASVTTCGLKADDEIEPGSPVTAGMMRSAVREVPMPRASLRAEPPGGTLIGVPAIFHTTTQTFSTSVTLLGHRVEIHAEPTRYTWHHGDGTSQTSSGPGRPYPAKDVTHEYRRVADDLAASVDVTYAVRYRVDGGAWLDLDAPLTAEGPLTRLDVDEAAPVLTGS